MKWAAPSTDPPLFRVEPPVLQRLLASSVCGSMMDSGAKQPIRHFVVWQSHNATFNNRGHRYSRCMCMCARAYEDKPRAPEVMLINGPVEGDCTPIFSLLLQFSLPVLLSLPLPYANFPQTNLNRAAHFSSTKFNGNLSKTGANCWRMFPLCPCLYDFILGQFPYLEAIGNMLKK